MINYIVEDKRKIVSLVIKDYCVYSIGGIDGIEEIIAYQELGENGCLDTWYAIIKKSEIKMRINGKYVLEIAY